MKKNTSPLLDSLIPQGEYKAFTNKLYALATRYLDTGQESDADIRKHNITHIYLDELKQAVDRKELINHNVNGLVTSGKSTTALLLTLSVLEYMKKPFTLANIAGDQVEYARKVTEDSTKDTVICIDEWNNMAETGENSTTEQKFLEYYSNVQAQKYVHRFACAPNEIVDTNCNVLIEIINSNKEQNVVTALVTYRLSRYGQTINQLLGYIQLNTTPIIEHPVYKLYRKKKFEKMHLVTRHGLRGKHELDTVFLINETLPQLHTLAETMPVDRGIIRNFFEMESKKQARFYSIVGSVVTIDRLYGYLQLYRKYKILDNQCEALVEAINGGKQVKNFNPAMTLEKLSTARKLLGDAIVAQKNEWQRLLIIRKEYDSIDSKPEVVE